MGTRILSVSCQHRLFITHVFVADAEQSVVVSGVTNEPENTKNSWWRSRLTCYLSVNIFPCNMKTSSRWREHHDLGLYCLRLDGLSQKKPSDKAGQWSNDQSKSTTEGLHFVRGVVQSRVCPQLPTTHNPHLPVVLCTAALPFSRSYSFVAVHCSSTRCSHIINKNKHKRKANLN